MSAQNVGKMASCYFHRITPAITIKKTHHEGGFFVVGYQAVLLDINL